MTLEKYIAAASLGLYIMFVGEILSVFHFLTDPSASIMNTGGFDAEPKIYQFISIGIAPAIILTGTSYIMSKRYGSKPIGIMIIAGGSIVLVGMAFAYTLIDQIDTSYIVDAIIITPLLFMIVSIPIIVFGVKLLKEKPRPKKIYF